MPGYQSEQDPERLWEAIRRHSFGSLICADDDVTPDQMAERINALLDGIRAFEIVVEEITGRFGPPFVPYRPTTAR